MPSRSLSYFYSFRRVDCYEFGTVNQCVRVNSSKIQRPLKRPNPEFFSPPKGAFDWSATLTPLICVIPISSCAAKAVPRSMFEVHTALDKPNSVALARFKACASSRAFKIGKIGPKLSCCARSESSATSIKICG